MGSRYIVVFGACLTQFTVIGLLFSFGLFFKVFETEFGWSRTLLSACSAASFLMMGVAAMAAGRLSDRFGPGRVLAASGVIYGTGFILMSLVGQPWQLLAICATFMGIGMSTHDVVTLSTVARWFEARRGLMTAVVKVGTAVGQIAVPPLTAALLLGFGWQVTLQILGVGAVVLMLASALMVRRPPLRHGTAAAGAATGKDFVEARRSRVFWTMCAIQFLFFPALMAVPTHLPVHGMDLGMTPATAATLLSVVGAASIAGRLSGGRLVDVIGGRRSLAVCFVVLMTGLAGFMVVTAPAALFAVVAVYGFGHGGLFVVVSPTLAEYFGMRAHGAIFGAVLFSGTIGGAIGPVLAGMAFDATGSYLLAFAGLLVLAGIGLALVWSLPRAAPGVPAPA